MRYTWLLLAAILVYLGHGDRPVEIAVWLAPVFLLRFTRGGRAWSSLLLTWPALTLPILLGNWGMSPAPLAVYAVSVVTSALLGLLPFILDRLAHPTLPRTAASLVFPFAMVAFEFAGSQGGYGSWGSSAYALRDHLLFAQYPVRSRRRPVS